MHFGMTGQLHYFKSTKKEPEHTRLLFYFDSGYQFAYDCQRLLGEVDIYDDPQQLINTKDLGPDALRLDFEAFQKKMDGRRGAIKTTLMNQQILAGIGNVYSDEILFQARLYPKTSVNELDGKTLRNIYQTMRDVLNTAIDCDAEPDQLPASYLIPHRESGAQCPHCEGKVEQIKFSGRHAYYCPHCQKET
jgi:formamidopyrimidine-DNA glycosylase